MTTNSLLVASDARVRSGEPKQNFGGVSKLTVASAPDSRISYVYFNQPFPLGVTVLSATLRLFQKGAATGGTRTVTAQRADAEWVESKIAYDGRPSATGAAAARALGNSATDGREWSFNVKTAMQQVADGAPWYGFRLISDIGTLMDFYAKEGGGRFTPVLEVEWSDAPAEPTQLSPAGARAVSVARPTLRFDYFDPDEGVLSGLQVQLSTSSSFAAPAIDSGQIAATMPEWTLTSDLTAGTTYYWRARVQDAAGLWSDWSDTAIFARTAKPTVAITNPSSGTPVVYESMPTFSWTVAGGAQQAYQLFIVDPADPTNVLWTSEKVTSAATSLQLPAKQRLLLSPGESYRLVLRVWDTVARESVPEETPYVEVTRDFTYGTTGSVTGVTAVTVITAPDSPFATIEFKRASAPDAFVIVEGAKVIAVVDPADIFVSGTTYRYVDRRVPPRSTRTWGVGARVGTQTSTMAPATGTVEPEGVWLYELEGDAAICISGNPDPAGMVTSNASEDTTVFKPLGSENPVLINQAIRGPEGEVDGTIEPGDLADWSKLTAGRAVTLGMTRADLAQKVQIYNTVRDHADEFGGEIPIRFSYVVIR